MSTLKVYKSRVNEVVVNTGIDLTGSTITSEIREQPDQDSVLIASWDVDVTDAPNGILVLSMDETESDVEQSKGFMDFKRVVGGDPFPMLSDYIEVEFRAAVTA